MLPRPRLRIRTDSLSGLLTPLEQTGDWVEVPAYAGEPPTPDPDGWPFIAASIVADCRLITGNVRDFPPQLGVRVMTAREWAVDLGMA